MSLASSLMIFLLCLSFHECNASRWASFDKRDKKFHISDQSNIQKEISVQRQVESSFSSNKQGEGVQSAISDDKVDEKLNKKKKPVKNVEKARKMSNYVDQNVSVESVSWVVPKQKRGAKHNPGFNLDYSPPKTHPPSHN